jgi:hypothetical protein
MYSKKTGSNRPFPGIQAMTPSTIFEPKALVDKSSLPRFQLRKRSTAAAPPAKPTKGLPAVNSAFLSGLFADVALFTSLDEENQDINKNTTTSSSSKRPNRDDTRLDAPPFTKKSRVSKGAAVQARSISRCNMSTRDLRILESPTTCSTNYFDDDSSYLLREDSLHLQLSCVGCFDTDASSSLAFPHLPATVSQSSCGSLTRNVSDLQSSVTENENAETYGWFVEMDSDGPSTILAESQDSYEGTTTNNKNTLAFCAATAPCADDHADEVEWAKAADTVDDVLGDFF